MKKMQSLFWEVIFFGEKIWAKILRNAKNLPAPTPMM